MLALLVGCSGGGAPAPAAPVEPALPRSSPASPRAEAAARPAARTRIPAGNVLAGSRPGTAGRRPAREADLVPIALPAFEIDREPVRGDGAGRPLVAHDRSEAENLCAARGGRLCTELEWERACEGEAHHTFPTGPSLDLEGCTLDLGACTSEFGVAAMGVEHPEWTRSDLPESLVALGARAAEASAVVRGARFDQPLASHRCDMRGGLAPRSEVGAAVRCCYGGDPSAAAYPEVATHPVFRAAELDDAALRAALAGIPELAAYAEDFTLHDAEDGDRALARGNAVRDALAGWELAEGPFFWSPTAGDELLVFSGRSAGGTLIAALYRLSDGTYVHGGAFVLAGEDAPIAISRTPPSRGELHWTACFGCAGESGVIRLDDEQVVRVLAY